MPTDDDAPPLITGRSPSYERAREERRHPSPTGDPEVVATLNAVAEAEATARQVCERGASLARNEALGKELRAEAQEHAQRRDAVAALVSERGGAAPESGGSSTAAQEMARARSDDDVRAAQRMLHDEVAAAWSTATGHARLDDALRTALAALTPRP